MSSLPRLLQAKSNSDKRSYRNKHAILRKLLSERPDDFLVDSYTKGIVGLTHPATGFRIHIPVAELPANFTPTTTDNYRVVNSTKPLHNTSNTTTSMNKSAFIKTASKTGFIRGLLGNTAKAADQTIDLVPKGTRSGAPWWAIPAVGMGTYGLGRHSGYNKGEQDAAPYYFGLGQDAGKQFGYGLAANQAQNTGLFGRVMGNYDFNPQVLGQMPQPDLKQLMSARGENPSRSGFIARSLPFM